MANGLAAPPLVIGAPGAGSAVAGAAGDVFANANNILQQMLVAKFKEKQQLGMLEQEFKLRSKLANEAEAAKQQELLIKSQNFAELIKNAKTPEDQLAALFESGLGTPEAASSLVSSSLRKPTFDEEKRAADLELVRARIEESKARKGQIGQPKPPTPPKPLNPIQNIELLSKFNKLSTDYGFDPKSVASKNALAALSKGDVEAMQDFINAVDVAKKFKDELDDVKADKELLKRLTKEELAAIEAFDATYKKDPVGSYEKILPISQAATERLSLENDKAAQIEALKKQKKKEQFDNFVNSIKQVGNPLAGF